MLPSCVNSEGITLRHAVRAVEFLLEAHAVGKIRLGYLWIDYHRFLWIGDECARLMEIALWGREGNEVMHDPVPNSALMPPTQNKMCFSPVAMKTADKHRNNYSSSETLRDCHPSTYLKTSFTAESNTDNYTQSIL